MEVSEQSQDTTNETTFFNDETNSNTLEPHRSQNDVRNENGNDDKLKAALSDEPNESAASPSCKSPGSDGSERLGVVNITSIDEIEHLRMKNSASTDTAEAISEVGDDGSDISELIRLASAAAVRDATRMKRSDSDLSESTNGNDDDDILEELLEEDIFVRQQQQNVYLGPPQLSMSSEYMEQASYEASLIDGVGNITKRTQLKPSGVMGRVGHRNSSLGIIEVDEMEEEKIDANGDGNNTEDTTGRRSSQRAFRDSMRPTEFETFHSLKSMSNLKSNDEEGGEHMEDNNDEKADSPTAEASSSDTLLTELLSKCGIKPTIYDDTREIDREIILLHALFDGFCRPPLRMYDIRKVVESEQQRMRSHQVDSKTNHDEFQVPLPLGVVIQSPSDVLLNLLTTRLSSSNSLCLEKLPPVFVSSLFRILLRLLEGYTDAQYDSSVILASCPWEHEVLTREESKTSQSVRENQSSAPAADEASAALEGKVFFGTTNDAAANANLMYSVARLRMKWQNAVKSMLLALRPLLLQEGQNQVDKSYLLFPMIRLTGVLCAGGVAVNELRQMISIAADHKLPVRVKHLMTRALSVAASAASPSTIPHRSLSSALVVLGKANPRNFFSFASGPGITRTINLDDQQQASWPFRNDFGAAFNFRVEDFSSNDGNKHIILFQALSDGGTGIELSLVPLSKGQKTQHFGTHPKSQSAAAILTIKTMENHNTIECIKVNNCPLHARMWYHVGVRHTRSRLKGMFSLSSREQLTVLVDGKSMLNESMKFPQIKPNYKSKQALSFNVGKNLDGQFGSIYIFRENVSDATFKALFELTSSESTSTNVGKGRAGTRSGEIAGQSQQSNEPMKGQSRNIQQDDLAHIAFSHPSPSSVEEGNMTRDIADLHKNEEKSDAKKPLSRVSFSSRLYISWNPCRKEKNFLMELHSGAHATLDHDFVQAVCINNAQQVITSIGGIQALLSIFQSLLGDESLDGTEKDNNISTFSLIPDLFILLSCFVRGNYQNARELLRCGGIDIVEQLLLQNKSKCMANTGYKKSAVFRSLFALPTLSKLLVRTLLELRSSCSHYSALEKRVVSALLFNVPLWLEWRGRNCGVSLYAFLLPTLSYIVKDNPAKVCDCVGATGMISCIRDIVEMDSNDMDEELPNLFYREPSDMDRMILLTCHERDYISNTLLAWLFQIFLTRPSRDDFSALIHLLSNYLEYEWNETTKDISTGNKNTKRTLYRHQRYSFLQRACILFYCTLESNPSQTIENFALACGSIDGAVAWLLSALVNSHCDLIRSVGIRCVGIYMRRTAHSPRLPLSFSPRTVSLRDARKKVMSGASTLQENTISLISNVGHGLLHANEKKVKSANELNTVSKITPGIIYKLLWHLLKSHRYRLGIYTQAALKSMVFKKEVPFVPGDISIDRLITMNSSSSPHAMEVDFDSVTSLMTRSYASTNECIRDFLSMNTILRALRFFPCEYSDNWLSSLVELCKTNQRATSTVAACADWQPSLFQFISEVIENAAPSMKLKNAESDETRTHEKIQSGSDRGFQLSLELYSILLGHIVRNNGEKAVAALEEAAALQRVYVNGPEVYALILSHAIANISHFGVMQVDPRTIPQMSKGEEGRRTVLKGHAKMVTDAILSNGARGMKLSEAMTLWNFFKYLTVATTAFVTSIEINQEFCVNAKKDAVTNGIFGTLLPEDAVGAFEFECLLDVYKESTDAEALFHKNMLQRLSIHVAAQLLSLLDVFIFPEDSSLDLKSSQLQGLALVRGTEKQSGNAQGPLLASLIRDSLLLLCRLEPSSVKMLQCCSRLRCFLHYSLELVRESDAMERYSGTFNKITLPFDRLLLSSFIRSHFALQKCAKLLREIEYDSTNPSPLYTSKETRKRSYRRIFRVTIELREILMTIYEKRSIVLRNALTEEAISAFQSCIESMVATDEQKKATGSSQKETIVRRLLSSDWVSKFEMSILRENDPISLLDDRANCILADEKLYIQETCRESSEIEKSFQKSLNSSFEDYLEKQRRWAETGAVRDLEFEGDTLLKTLSVMCKQDRKIVTKDPAGLSVATNLHWEAIDKRSRLVWEPSTRWKLSTFTDNCGRRILLDPNLKFDSHESARYASMMGQDRDEEETERKDQILQNEITDLMKRNSEAITSYDEILALEDTNGEDKKEETDETEFDESFLEPEIAETPSNDLLSESSEADGMEDRSLVEEVNDDGDEWARAFVWEDAETIVARFEEVMVVTLRYSFEGSLLLTTAGLYFHQIGNGTNVINKQPCGFPKSDRHWRLNGLEEVHGRRYMLRTQALELFFADGHELFLNFRRGTKERNRFYAKLRNSCNVPMIFSPKSLNPRVVFKKTKITEMWRKRKISNFDYLIALNRMAGRTFNDISQYPVFPWILNDYESEKIDLSDSRVYRDLSKPVGALNPDRLAVLIERYQELESFGFAPEEKFLYGSHYSSPGLVLHFLIRQEPFTSMAIDLQSGKFDCPDRLFFDLKESWKSCNTSSSDVKELIPELFTVPEVLQNSNRFPLGTTQKGLSVDNVGLPPWAKGSAHEFVRIHRLALESEYVSRNLQNWIDLVFGYKQRGIEAEKAWNVFHYFSYEGSVNLDKMKDDVDRIAAESQIQNFGQTPSQLIVKDPHPSRYALELSWKPLINNVATAVRLRCHTPAQQFGGKSGRGAGAVVKIHVSSDSLIAVYSDLKIGFFWLSPKSANNRLIPDRLLSIPSRNLSYSRCVVKRGSAIPQTVGERTSPFAVGNWSFAMSIGGYEKEQLRRRKAVHSRLASAKDALYTDAPPLLVSCGYWDNTIKVHSTDAWKLESSYNGGHRGAIRCLAMGTDGGILVTGGEDCTCRVWVLDHPELAAVLSDGYTQTALGRRPNENQVLTCCQVLAGHQSAISCIAMSSELGIVVSGSMEGKICIHKLRTGEFVRSFKPSNPKTRNIDAHNPVPVTKIILEEHGRMVIQMGDYQLYTFTVNGVCLCSVNAGEQIHDMQITGEVVVTGGENGHVYIRNLTTLKILSGLNLSKHGPIRCVTFTPADLHPLPQFLFIGSDDGMISIVEQD